ncbi:CehA/McbA family metallohydrolase [Paenibacillus sp. MWE-103]|uniref:CehA/McbA family metallohydrolase n=1 Tax=Paenibacillus artemisiicola TaxID=1172618 RepID=A0ABS3WGD6_9BACL|nr:CehA/McbA family metallohydrolase [Paenibacillus artemisiicola]MBO7747313.1 CehA/McbA family metallohydrolase [Paenibacillus artemisiicola]
MKPIVYLDGSKRKYKGNLHTHSTRSDGQYAPETVIQAYKDRGYDFMCLSDHEIYWKSDAFDDERFIMLDGYEMACEMSWRETGQQYHIHGLLDRSLGSSDEFAHDEEHAKPDYAGLETIQALIDEMRAKGNLVILNHPTWSRNEPEDLLQLEGYAAVEIYNHQSELDEAVGYGLRHWDYLLARGRKVFGVAADDAHGGPIDAAVSEFFGGWVAVEADALKQDAVIDAMKAGRYYSSNGPEIRDLRVEDGYLKVTCSDVKFIKFITHPFNGRTIFNRDASPVREGAFRLDGGEVYVRVECVDYEGNVAWSNPVFPDDLK